MESNTETYISICKVDSPRACAVCLREHTRGLCTKPGAGVGGGGRGHVHTYGRFMPRFDRTQQNSVKQLSIKLIIQLNN